MRTVCGHDKCAKVKDGECFVYAQSPAVLGGEKVLRGAGVISYQAYVGGGYRKHSDMKTQDEWLAEAREEERGVRRRRSEETWAL